MTVFNDLPVWEWSTIFRPHTWGYLVFDLNHGASWFWNIPGFALLVGVYQLSVTVAPKRVVTALAISATTYFSPFIHWWYQPTTIWSVAWVAIAITALIWVLKSDSLGARVFWSFIFFYVTVLLALEIYVPFIIPGILIFIFVGIGLLIDNRVRNGSVLHQIGQIACRMVPIAIAGMAAIFAVGIWAVTRLETIRAMLNTVYPGERQIHSGEATFSPDGRIISLTAGLWSSILKSGGSTYPLGTNQSEASAALPVTLALLPSVLAVTVIIGYRYRLLLTPLLASALATMIFLAFLYIPGWDSVAHLLFLDRVPGARMKIAFVMLIPIMWAFLIRAVDDYPELPRKWLAILAAATAIVVVLPSLILIWNNAGAISLLSPYWFMSFGFFVIGIGVQFVPKAISIGAILISICGAVVSIGINPLYLGIINLNETKTGQEIARIQSNNPGVWIGVGGWLPSDLLTQSGVPSFTGFQNYPINDIWEKFDPTKEYEANWNRLGHINWGLSTGPISIANPQPDVITVQFDPCDPLIQQNTKYLLSSVQISGYESCLTPISSEKEPGADFWFYEFSRNPKP